MAIAIFSVYAMLHLLAVIAIIECCSNEKSKEKVIHNSFGTIKLYSRLALTYPLLILLTRVLLAGLIVVDIGGYAKVGIFHSS